MSNKHETVTFTKVVEIVDADGKPIREGSVLQEVDGTYRGVVTQIRRSDDLAGPMLSAVGDLCICSSPGSLRVTNRYSKWRHIPRNDQTYDERLLSWQQQPYVPFEYTDASEDEGRAIDGIMALLPDDAVDWEMGPWPDRLEDALQFLVTHLKRCERRNKSE